MRVVGKPTFCAIALATCLPLVNPNLRAQSDDEVGIWVGASAGTPTLIGKTEHVSFVVSGVGYSRLFVKRPSFNLRYTIDVLPVARLNHISGKGAVPIGFEVSFRPARRVEPAAALNGGFIYFERPIPENGGARFNFLASLGLGVRFRIAGKWGAHAGYKYHHLSNGYRAAFNPGFDSNLLFLQAIVGID
jgi:hypothetical protein